MITKSDIQCVCNYVESSTPSGSSLPITYVDRHADDAYQLELKRKNRNLVIDSILDDKDEECENSGNTWGQDPIDESETAYISFQLKTLTLKSNMFTGIDDLYDTVLKRLESLTSSPMTTTKFQPNVTISNNISMSDRENFETNSRRIISRINMMSYLISSEGYSGPATTIICGYDTRRYIESSCIFMPSKIGESIGIINGMNVIYSHLISRNKIIVMRAVTKTETGLNVINNTNDSTYFMAETPSSWTRYINWFSVI